MIRRCLGEKFMIRRPRTLASLLARVLWVQRFEWRAAAILFTLFAAAASLRAEFPTALTVFPSTIALEGARAEQQLIITGHFAPSLVRDLTHEVRFASSAPQVAEVSAQGKVTPRGNGTALVRVSAGNATCSVPVTVRDFDRP